MTLGVAIQMDHVSTIDIDGGAYAEETLRRNVRDLEAIALRHTLNGHHVNLPYPPLHQKKGESVSRIAFEIISLTRGDDAAKS